MKKIFLTANTDWYLYRFRFSLAASLRREGLEPVFVSPPGRFVPRLEEGGFRWIQWNMDRRGVSPWKEIMTVIQFNSILTREKPDLIHNHTIKPVLYGSLTARLVHQCLMINAITGRGYLFINPPVGVKLLRALVVPVYRFVTNHPSFVTLFENQSDLEYFASLKMFTRTRNVIVPGVGVDSELFSPQPEEAGTPVVAYVGRLLWDKGVDTFVRAAELLKASKQPTRMVLIGTTDPGNPASIPEKLIVQWANSGVIEWWGWQEDMPEIYRQCHVVVMPSLSEGLSTTILEAMSSERAVIATDVPGCRELVHHQETGLLVQPGNPQELAHAIHSLLADETLRRQLAQAGRQLVLEKYTINRINDLTLRLYHEILG
jgi:glycosyltransferase involved in cell wall biosynthesis